VRAACTACIIAALTARRLYCRCSSTSFAVHPVHGTDTDWTSKQQPQTSSNLSRSTLAIDTNGTHTQPIQSSCRTPDFEKPVVRARQGRGDQEDARGRA
jgi:hypothetical protein